MIYRHYPICEPLRQEQQEIAAQEDRDKMSFLCMLSVLMIGVACGVFWREILGVVL